MIYVILWIVLNDIFFLFGSFFHGRLSEGPDIGCWYHESFVRGSPSKIYGMKRTKIKVKARSARNLAHTKGPNFYKPSPSTSSEEFEDTEMPESTLARNTSQASLSSNASAFELKPIGTDQKTILSKSRRVPVESEVPSIDQIYYHGSQQYVFEGLERINEFISTANTPRGLSSYECSVPQKELREHCYTCQEGIEPLPFNEDVALGDFVGCIDNVLEAL